MKRATETFAGGARSSVWPADQYYANAAAPQRDTKGTKCSP